MSIHEKMIQRLKQNWVDRESGLPVYALVRYFVPGATREIYIYAINPDDDQEFRCIYGHNGNYNDELWLFLSIALSDDWVVDGSFRPRQIDTLLTLNRERPYEAR